MFPISVFGNLKMVVIRKSDKIVEKIVMDIDDGRFRIKFPTYI